MGNRVLRSLVWFLVSFVLTVFAGLAMAQTPVEREYYYYVQLSGSSYGPTQDSACIRRLGAVGGWTFTDVQISSPTVFYCYGTKPGVNGGNRARAATGGRMQCPADKPYFADTYCVAEKPPEGPGDDPNLCSDKNPFVRRWDYAPTGSYGPPSHYAGCVVEVIEMMVCRKEPSGSRYCMWMVKRTGERYTGPDTPGTGGNDNPENKDNPPTTSPPIESPPKPDDPPGKNPCPAGTVHGGMSHSGIPMCIGTGSNPKPDTKTPPKIEAEKTEQNADGSTTTTKTVTTTNSDGSTTKHTTVTTTQPDGSKQVSGGSETSATPGGQPGKADRPPEDDKYDLCKMNPNLSICRESSVSGSCGQIACQGDAIQCATLRAAAAMECKQRTDEDAVKASAAHALGTAAMSGNDPAASTLPTVSNARVVDVTGLASEGWLGAGAAFNDVSFSLMGQTVVVPLEKVTGYLVGLRYALMVVASLVSFRILSGAILRE